MRILLFLLDLFFSRSRCFKDEEMNRFSKRGDPIENRRTPDASKRSIQRRRSTSSSRRMRKPSFTERQKRKHARSARVKKRFTQLQKYARAREREREKEKEMNQTIVKKTTTTTTSNAPARASFCATNNPSNGLFLCHWRTLARFSIASSAASSNRKRQYACGLIDCSMIV